MNTQNALLAANLHGNLGGCYHRIGKDDFAKIHMEQGIHLLDEYNLTGCHDTVPQVCNYASLLTQLGEPDRAYTALKKLSNLVQEYNSDYCLDCGMVQQYMGAVSIHREDMTATIMHYQKAMAIFEALYEEQPEFLAEKCRELALPGPK